MYIFKDCAFKCQIDATFFWMLFTKACFLEPWFVNQTFTHCVGFNLSVTLDHYFNEWFCIRK